MILEVLTRLLQFLYLTLLIVQLILDSIEILKHNAVALFNILALLGVAGFVDFILEEELLLELIQKS